MRIEIEIPDGLFRSSKTEREVAAELKQAAVFYWLARGEIRRPDADRVIGAGTRFKDLKEALGAFPDVGRDEDFERSAESPADRDR